MSGRRPWELWKIFKKSAGDPSPEAGGPDAKSRSKNPLRYITGIFNPQAAVEEGWAYKHPKPKLSPEKRKELMEASALETPRSSLRAMMGILTPYWTKASIPERLTGAALLATSLAMTWYAVQITVDFGHWQSGLTNTVQQLFQTMMASRPEIIGDIIGNYPALQDVLSNNELLNEMLMKYPDTTSILYDPAFQDLINSNPGLAELLQKNPTMEDVFMQFPAFKEQVAANPEILGELRAFNDNLSDQVFKRPTLQKHLSTLWAMSGGDFVTNMGTVLKENFNAVAKGEILNKPSREAFKNLWYSKDLATIALKFTAMAIASYKSAQYLALRWRAWTTGYFTNKWTNSKAFQRLKNTFNNIDNPGQRIQEDPAKFTAGAVSLMTGVAHSAITFGSFIGLLWGLGPVMGVPGGFAWMATAYAGALTALTVGAGYKLPWIQRNQQRREADFRGALDKVHNNADVIAQNNGEAVENDLAKKRFKPVMTNSVREIGTQVKLIVVDATAGNLSIPIPWVVGAFAVAAGTASMGTIQTLNYAFNRVTSALSFVVNRFGELSQMKATADRIYMFDQAVDAAHYIEEEKRQASQKLLPPPPAIAPPDTHMPQGPNAPQGM